MKLIKSLITRLSDSLFASVPDRLRAGARTRLAPVLRLVSHNLYPAAPAAAPRRTAGSAHGQSEAIEDAMRRSQAWLLGRQNQREGFWVAELEADTTLTS